MQLREIALFSGLHKKWNIGMHSDFHEPVWSELSMMIDTTEFYILILVQVILTVIQSHRDARSKTFRANHLTKFAVKLNGIWYAVEICWSDESDAHNWTLHFDTSVNGLDLHSTHS